MPNYTKLFNSIITSTIWTEDDKTRIMWITMLAMSDKNGEVHGSVPGMARMSSMSVHDAEMAIEKLMAPDPYSRTPDNEGRRIAKIEGGWELLNHGKYRLMASKEDEKAATAARVRRHRSRNANVTACNANVTACNGDVTACNGDVTEDRDIADTEAEADPFNKRERETASPKIARPTLSQAKAVAQNIGITPEKAEEWWNCREASEWMKGMAGGGTSPVGTNWQADMTTYCKRGGMNGGNEKSGPKTTTAASYGI